MAVRAEPGRASEHELLGVIHSHSVSGEYARLEAGVKRYVPRNMLMKELVCITSDSY